MLKLLLISGLLGPVLGFASTPCQKWLVNSEFETNSIIELCKVEDRWEGKYLNTPDPSKISLTFSVGKSILAVINFTKANYKAVWLGERVIANGKEIIAGQGRDTSNTIYTFTLKNISE